ncbi:acyltransferase [Neobacillus citreus]|uniref:Acyltransferase n=1 Tax=Neobacillus citreus TaxID=2833578 RepID=A0A942T1A1_9BACI|nr:acyltransferase [Neobacillus citreus]MCH6266531.1 acyltransferase [Neobacillus citreus]
MKKVKLEEIEVLRGIAFLAVVLQHALAAIFIQPDINLSKITIATTLLGLTRFAVPLFVFISGVVLFYNYNNKLDYRSFLRKRFTQIFIPYFFWTIFYYVWASMLGGVASTSTFGQIQDITQLTFTGEGYYHLWFMVMIIPFYFLFPFFRTFLSKYRRMSTNLMVLTVFFAINLSIVWALNRGFIHSANPNLGFIFNYLDRNFIFWIFYFILGGFVGLYYEQWKIFVRRSRFFIMAGIGICVYLIYSDIAIINQNLTGNNYIQSSWVTGPLRPFMMVAILFLIVFIFFITEKLVQKKSFITKMLNAFGKYSFGAYLIHAFVLRFTNQLAINFFSNSGVFFQTAVSFILCSIISTLFCLIISKMKISSGEVIMGKV